MGYVGGQIFLWGLFVMTLEYKVKKQNLYPKDPVKCRSAFINLNNYFDFHVCLSFRSCVRVRVSEDYLRFLQAYHKMSVVKVVWYALRVKSLHPGSPSHPSQTAAAEAKPRCVYSILKPHGHSSKRQI